MKIDSGKILYSKGGNDECYTPKCGVEPLKEFLEKFKGKIIWCPFDVEESNFVVLLKEWGHKVVHSHIWEGKDFFEYEPEEFDLIVSNPPFTNKRAIFERALSFGKPFALLMSNTWLNDSAPKQLFKKERLELLMFDKRIEFNDNKKITFSSSYFCHNFLENQIEIRFITKTDSFSPSHEE